ncbi:hypothetical protein [Haloarchaeobius sp. DYHT-AS-18]|uniref:hypothetical protein n=1 Tax=Haloarchaeobius sp. DYHT-AS-18 TaxID=3446117 RepID=UPI003EBEE20E
MNPEQVCSGKGPEVVPGVGFQSQAPDRTISFGYFYKRDSAVSQQIPKTHRDGLEPYISGGEKVHDVVSTGPKTYVLTDSRIVSIWRGAESSSGRAREQVTTTQLGHVASASVDFHGEEPVDTESLIAGGISAFLGLLGVVSASLLSEQTLQLLAIVLGVVFVLVGGYYILKAYDTDSAFVQLHMTLADGTKKSVSFSERGSGFVESVTEQFGRV